MAPPATAPPQPPAPAPAARAAAAARRAPSAKPKGLSSPTTSTSGITCGSINHQLCVAIVLLSIALLKPGQTAAAASAYGLARPLPAQLLLHELLSSAGNEDNTYYGEQLRYQQEEQQQQQQQQEQQQLQQHAQPAPLPPNYFVSKWPGLRDLLLTADYEDANGLESTEQLNSRLLARLRKLSENSAAPHTVDELSYTVDGNALTAMPSKKLANVKLSSSVREHNTKKNVQYMSPCHFKICNMGRKRNAGSFMPY